MKKNNNLKAICKNIDINITKLCKEVGITRQQFYNICNNKCEPSIYTAIAIANYLKIDIYFIFGIENEAYT